MNKGSLRAAWVFDEGSGKTVLEQVSQLQDPISYIFNNARFKPSSDPLWRTGIHGQALLFDGYSTWVTHAREAFQTPTTAFTISAWIAPRSFEAGIGGQLSAIVNQHDRLAMQGFILGTFTHGEWGLQVGTGSEWVEVWSREKRLPRHAWAYVAATFDSVNGCLRLYLDGEFAAEQVCAPGTTLQPAVKDVLIGGNNNPTSVGHVFEANLFDGMIDELEIHDVAWDAAQAKARYLADLNSCGGAKPAADTCARRSRYAGDRHRPQYHFIPPQHWMNEPHALLHFKGKYHITYQHNAHAPFWHNISWGHAVSDDLVHWKDLPDALVPEKDTVAPDGIWSGSACLDGDDNPAFFFTAGNNAMSPNQMTGLARSTYLQDGDLDLKYWQIHEKPITVLDRNIEIMGHKLLPDEFRDAYVWREGNFWCQLVGSGVQDVGGTALLYTSDDLIHWEYRKPFLVGDINRYPLTSMMWELPVFLPLGQGKHIFLFSPWWSRPSPHFLKYVPYWIGTWDAESLTFTPDHAEPRIFDYGEHFTGPSGSVDELGRAIVFNIAQTKRNPQDAYDSGWDNNAGLPIILSLHDDGDLSVKPVPELERLRGKRLVSLRNTSLDEANRQLTSIGGTMLEIRLDVHIPEGQRCGIKVRRSRDGVEETLIYYDARYDTFSIDRDNSSLTATVQQRGIQGGALMLGDGIFRLHVYVDHSMIEAYANERKSITSRVYPSRSDAIGVQMWGRAETMVERLEIWELHSAYNE